MPLRFSVTSVSASLKSSLWACILVCADLVILGGVASPQTCLADLASRDICGVFHTRGACSCIFDCRYRQKTAVTSIDTSLGNWILRLNSMQKDISETALQDTSIPCAALLSDVHPVRLSISEHRSGRGRQEDSQEKPFNELHQHPGLQNTEKYKKRKNAKMRNCLLRRRTATCSVLGQGLHNGLSLHSSYMQSRAH